MNFSSSITSNGGFEGPEKVIEINLAPHTGPENGKGLRNLSLEDWSTVLGAAKCTILCKESNEYFDAYILSESSLFVYPYKCIIKTCGTIALLLVIPILRRYVRKLKLEFDWVSYSRKNFLYPEKQVYPHLSMDQEILFLDKYFKDVEAFVLGPLTSDHWCFYSADYSSNFPKLKQECTIDIMMYDMDLSVAQLFFQKDGISASDVTTRSGIRDLIPDSIIHEHMFSPCGYSMNGLKNDTYWTIHITPESQCSYVSFETNLLLENYTDLLILVLQTFKPRKFTLTYFCDSAILDTVKQIPVDVQCYDVGPKGDFYKYIRLNKGENLIQADYNCIMGNYVESSAIKGTISPRLRNYIETD
ncbi:hypothetical protein WA158_000893 [Blastocystis sp. Blastoise]